MAWIKFPDLVLFSQVKWSHLDQHLLLFIILIFISSISLICLICYLHAYFSVALRYYDIKNRDHICWITFNLSVELRIIIINVSTVKIQYIILSHHHLFQLFDIIWILGKIFGIFSHISIGIDEVSDFALHFSGVNSCSPNQLLSCAGWFLSIGHMM